MMQYDHCLRELETHQSWADIVKKDFKPSETGPIVGSFAVDSNDTNKILDVNPTTGGTTIAEDCVKLMNTLNSFKPKTVLVHKDGLYFSQEERNDYNTVQETILKTYCSVYNSFEMQRSIGT